MSRVVGGQPKPQMFLSAKEDDEEDRVRRTGGVGSDLCWVGGLMKGKRNERWRNSRHLVETGKMWIALLYRNSQRPRGSGDLSNIRFTSSCSLSRHSGVR